MNYVHLAYRKSLSLLSFSKLASFCDLAWKIHSSKLFWVHRVIYWVAWIGKYFALSVLWPETNQSNSITYQYYTWYQRIFDLNYRNSDLWIQFTRTITIIYNSVSFYFVMVYLGKSAASSFTGSARFYCETDSVSDVTSMQSTTHGR